MRKAKKKILLRAKKAFWKIKAFLKGFSMVEIIVVIAIIAVLAATVVPAVSSQLGKAKDGSVKANVSQISKKLSIYYIENFSFPLEEEWPETAGENYGFNADPNSGAFVVYGALPSGGYFAQDSAGRTAVLSNQPDPGTYIVQEGSGSGENGSGETFWNIQYYAIK